MKHQVDLPEILGPNENMVFLFNFSWLCSYKEIHETHDLELKGKTVR